MVQPAAPAAPAVQVKLVGKQRLVLDLSCRKKEDGQYYVVTDRWQKFSSLALRCGPLVKCTSTSTPLQQALCEPQPFACPADQLACRR